MSAINPIIYIRREGGSNTQYYVVSLRMPGLNGGLGEPVYFLNRKTHDCDCTFNQNYGADRDLVRLMRNIIPFQWDSLYD